MDRDHVDLAGPDAWPEVLQRGPLGGVAGVASRRGLDRHRPVAVEVGLDAAEVRATLASDAYAREVREDEQQARELGVRGVPFFVLAGRYAVSGAQPADALLAALHTAWASAQPEQLAGAACGPGGCG